MIEVSSSWISNLDQVGDDLATSILARCVNIQSKWKVVDFLRVDVPHSEDDYGNHYKSDVFFSLIF